MHFSPPGSRPLAPRASEDFEELPRLPVLLSNIFVQAGSKGSVSSGSFAAEPNVFAAEPIRISIQRSISIDVKTALDEKMLPEPDAPF